MDLAPYHHAKSRRDMTANTKKVPLADVLWEAANTRLAANEEAHTPYFGMFRESCCSVLEVVRPGWYDVTDFVICVDHPALVFLSELGCDYGTSYFDDEYPAERDDEQRQGARYMWLLLAMHVAEDEGVQIDVQS